MYKKIIFTSLFALATTASAQSTECITGLKELWMGPVAKEVAKKYQKSPSQISQIVKAYQNKNDKGVSYNKLVSSYQCNAFNVGEMGYVTFENSDLEIMMAAYGGAQAMKKQKTCFVVGLRDKVNNKFESTRAKLIVDKAFPFPEPVDECE